MASKAVKSRFTVRNLVTYSVSSLFFCLTILFFSPLEIILNNIQEFRFSFGNVWGFQLLAAVLSAAVLTLILFLFPPRAGMVLAALITAGGVAAWIQLMLMNGNMTLLTGEKTEQSSLWLIINLLIWLVIIVAFLLVFFRLKKRDAILSHKMLRVVGGLLLIMQAGAMIALAAGTEMPAKSSEYHLTNDGMFDFGQGENAVIIVLDTADQEYAEEMLAHYPELKDSLSGWTYYPNATSVYSRTYPSLTYMLTGEKCWFDKERSEYVAEAFTNSGYLQTIRDQGTDIRIYTPAPELLGSEGMQYLANGIYSGDERHNLAYFQLEKNLVRIALNRCMPYLFKDYFGYNINIINLSSFTYRPFRQFMDPVIYGELQSHHGISVRESGEKSFKLYHLYGVHPGANWDSNLQSADSPEKYDILRGSFRFVEAYIDALKKAGIYDQTLIIVTADHGISDGDRDHYERDRASNPLLMVKYPYSNPSASLEVNKAPVSHEDLFATVFAALSCSDGKIYGSGKALKDFSESDQRVRTHYFTAIDQKTREVALVEYEIDGDARDFGTWHKTGRYWEVLYSANPVSEKRYSEQ